MNNADKKYNVNDLAQFMIKAKEEGQPYVFLTGAGCSVTAGIPLADKIVEELNKEFDLELKLLSSEERQDYGKCMSFIETSKRREYLKRYIDNAKINWAHIALASLLKAEYISRVLTFNFDNLLARSCGLLGLYPATYDFTAANLNLHNLIDDPAIVHLHGQGHGFVQLNTASETSEHANQLKDFIRHTLNESPTLFIGYSGHNDAFLPQIEAQFNEQKRLFWVDMGDNAPEHLQQSLLKSSLAHYMSCNNGGADRFLVELARKLDCFPPEIFVDPYQHLINEMDEIADYPISEVKVTKDSISTLVSNTTNTEDILYGTKARLKTAKLRDDESNNFNIVEKYLKGSYKEIISHIEGKRKVGISEDEDVWLARSYLSLASQEQNIKTKIELYSKLINTYENNENLKIKKLVIEGSYNKLSLLRDIKALDEALLVADNIIKNLNISDDLEIQEIVGSAYMQKGLILYDLKRSEDAFNTYTEFVEMFKHSETPILQQSIQLAILGKAVISSRLNRFDEAFSIYEEYRSTIKSIENPLDNAQAYLNLSIGQTHIIKAKKYWPDNILFKKNIIESKTYLTQAFIDISGDLSNSTAGWVLGYLAYNNFLLGHYIKAKEELESALRIKDKELYEDLLETININSIDLDYKFEKLLKNTWNKFENQ